MGPREPPPQASPLDGVTRTQGSTSLCSLKFHTPPLRASPGPKAPPSGGWITYTWKPDFANVLVSPGPQALLFLGCPRLHTLVVVTQAPSLGVVPEIHMNSRLYSRLGWRHNGPLWGLHGSEFLSVGESPSPQDVVQAGVTSTQAWIPSWGLPGPRS